MIPSVLDISPLALQLRETIRREGPISFHDWMRTALYDPVAGYYCRATGKKWGREGDYRTSPEASPLFSSTFARYFVRLYDELDQPQQWTIVEAGAGAGHFAAGVLRALQKFFPAVFAATTYVVNEVSPGSREEASVRLGEFADRVTFDNGSPEELNPGIIFSNELLDALPVHRLSFDNDDFKEFYVALDAAGEFCWELRELSPELRKRVLAYCETSEIHPAGGQSFEVCLEVEDWLKNVSRRLSRGYVVSVDYGFSTSEFPAESRSTLRGFQRHRFIDDLLARPGDHDITASVDWDFVRSVGTQNGLQTIEFERQDRFLLAAGLLDQLELESANCRDEGERLRLSTSVREMILPDSMSTYFQVLVQKKIV